MKPVSRTLLPWTTTCIIVSFALACSHHAIAPESKTAENGPSPSQLPEVPSYAEVPHPSGIDLSDVRALFRVKGAPELKDLQDCDSGYQKLKTVTASLYELQEGVRELVRQDPVHYHWCFYGKVLSLEEILSGNTYIDERQKATIDTYSFLAPVARAFMTDYYDSRYLRWAMRRYESISERIFYRRLQNTPGSTSEIVEATNPFGLWKDTARGPAAPDNVLEKYGLAPPQTLKPVPAVNTVALVPVTAPVTPVTAMPPAAPVAVAIPAVEAVPNIVAAPATVAADPIAATAPVTVPVTAPVPATPAALAAASPPPPQGPSDTVSQAAIKAAAAGAASQSAIYGSSASVGTSAPEAAPETAPETAPVSRLPAQQAPATTAPVDADKK